MTRDVLVPIDGSPLSYRALRYALREFPDASVTVLHVVDVFDPAPSASAGVAPTYEPLIGSEEWYEQAGELSAQLFEEAEAIADEHDRELATTSEIGDPDRVIVDFADEEDIDHVVLGAHGQAAEESPVFGRTAETVVRRATVPVTLIK